MQFHKVVICSSGHHFNDSIVRKFYWGSTKPFRPSEVKGLEQTAEKLKRLKDKSILLIFIHGYIKGNAKEILDTEFKGLNKEIITSGIWEKD